jgi:hypothetical protein
MRLWACIAFFSFLATPVFATDPADPDPSAAPGGETGTPTEEVSEPEVGSMQTPPVAETQPLDEALPAAGFVARSVFTTDILEREPLDSVTTLGNDQGVIFFFTDLRNLAGRTVIHRWRWNGTVIADVPIEVGGPRWRAYSSKSLHPSWLGAWTVAVVDQTGEVLVEREFSYVQAEEAPGDLSPAAVDDAESPPADAALP